MSGKYLAISMRLNLYLLGSRGERVLGHLVYRTQVRRERARMIVVTIFHYLEPARRKTRFGGSPQQLRGR